jgi:phenylalanyl-tRNA synthetase alpha chain
VTDEATLAGTRAAFLDELARVGSESELRALRDRYLGRKAGIVTALVKAVAAAPVEDRPRLGRLANQLKQDVEAALDSGRAALAAEGPRLPGVDVTLPGRDAWLGRRHPLASVREWVEEIFLRMGYEVVEGPELEDDYHNFEALNMPADHPARDMQDTLYLASPVRLGSHTATLLRTHTSGMQIRYMETHRPPVRIISPGRVYRRDNLDLTHTPMFMQFEGLVVDEGITLADLKGTLAAFAREVFGAETAVRFRPSFFPYTEPSAELDIGCVHCGGRGCPVCKRTGWLEVLGSGMVHPAVFEAVGYDSERYTGFAFGMGVERVALLKYGVESIRQFYEGDLRFLEQFPA